MRPIKIEFRKRGSIEIIASHSRVYTPQEISRTDKIEEESLPDNMESNFSYF